MILKTNKTSIKWPKPKIKNQNNKNWNWNNNNQESQAIIFKGGERKEGKKKKIHQHQTRPSMVMYSTLIKKEHGDAFNNAHEEYFWMSGGVACAAWMVSVPPTNPQVLHTHANFFFI